MLAATAIDVIRSVAWPEHADLSDPAAVGGQWIAIIGLTMFAAGLHSWLRAVRGATP